MLEHASNEKPLLYVESLVKHYPILGGVFLKAVAAVKAVDGVDLTIYPGETNTPILDERPSPPPQEKRAEMLQPEDIAACVIMVAGLPARAVVPELVVTPPYMLLD